MSLEQFACACAGLADRDARRFPRHGHHLGVFVRNRHRFEFAVGQEQKQRAPLGHRRDRDADQLVERVAQIVRDVQHLVNSREQAQAVFRVFAIVDVGAGSEPANDSALTIANRNAARQVPVIRVVYAANSRFDLIERPARECRAPALHDANIIVGMDEPAPIGSLSRDARGHVEARVVLPAPVEPQPPPVGRRHPSQVRHGVRHGAPGGVGLVGPDEIRDLIGC